MKLVNGLAKKNEFGWEIPNREDFIELCSPQCTEYDLFKFISISDGSSANTEVKVSIVNMSFKNRTFDVLVRSFYDSDSAPVVLEK